MCIVYGDVPKPKSNLDLCTNPYGVPILSWVMLDLLRSQSLLAPFSTTSLSIKKCSSSDLNLLYFKKQSVIFINMLKIRKVPKKFKINFRKILEKSLKLEIQYLTNYNSFFYEILSIR